MRVLLVRHGETSANVERRIQGQSRDSELTVRGHDQVNKVAAFLRQTVVAPVCVWTSPAGRAKRSAEIIASALEGSELRADAALMQRGWGQVEGRVLSGNSWLDAERIFTGEPGGNLPGDAESLESVWERLKALTARLLASGREHHVIISHDELLNYLINYWDARRLRKYCFRNGDVVSTRLSPGGVLDGTPQRIFPKYVVAIRGAPTSVDRGLGVIVRAHDLEVVMGDAVPNADAVLAVVLGDGGFSVTEASRYPNLKTVARYGTGINGIDVQGLAQHRILVTRVVGTSARPVAEYVLLTSSLLLRGVFFAAGALQQDPTSWRPPNWQPGLGLRDTTFGVIGYGWIGRELVSIARSCGANVLVWTRTQTDARRREIEMAGATLVPALSGVLEGSDVISVHVPLMPETQGLLGTEAFSIIGRAGRRPVIVNTSRGGVVSEECLLVALESGVVSGAVLDVWSDEQGPRTEIVVKLRSHVAVVPTPHIAAATEGALRASAERCALNVVSAVEGRLSEISEICETP